MFVKINKRRDKHGEMTYTASFGWLNWLVLVLYLVGMILLGVYFMRRQKGGEDFFKGGGRIPWWAAGISIFATMLSASAIKLPYLDMFLGTEMGMLGETSAAAILLGFAILLATRTITWHVTIPYLATVFLLSLPTGHDPLAQVLSGGLMLGAVFMATDYSSSPMTAKGKVIYGIGCGLICCVIRFWGNMNEGCAYSILLMDLLVPYIDRACALTPFGDEKPGLLARLRARKGGERQ